jgi:hypothetical protein
VGTPANPQLWFDAVALLRWGVLRDYASDIALFVGCVDNRTIALIGSSESLVGAARTSDAQHSLDYYTLRFLNRVIEKGPALLGQVPIAAVLGEMPSTSALAGYLRAERRMTFLALTIHADADVLVGTPLYVALA